MRTDGLTTEEHDELRRLRREGRQLREERTILSKAADWYAKWLAPRIKKAFEKAYKSVVFQNPEDERWADQVDDPLPEFRRVRRMALRHRGPSFPPQRWGVHENGHG